MAHMSGNVAHQVEGFAAVLGVRDVGAAIAYYRDILGFAVEFTWDEPPNYAGFRLGAACLHLAQSTGETRGRVCFFCSDLDGVHRQLADNGARITHPITAEPYGMREFWVTDLDGNELIFGEPTHPEKTHA
jgi:uncharacterized glyoxalase superfamily protein PhnB